MDYSDIIDVTTDLFGKQLSKQSITNITDKFLVNVEEFKKRQLKKNIKLSTWMQHFWALNVVHIAKKLFI
ncbi:transposase [Mycoplasma aquilae ATCC BAA-1896]|uniref:transposase n=1 Tax=Mycoplasma aquilae TaxID=1312741 RepID=UPI003A88BCB2